MPRPTSRKRLALFGAVAGGKATKAMGLTKAEAKTRLRGVQESQLSKKKE